TRVAHRQVEPGFARVLRRPERGDRSRGRGGVPAVPALPLPSAACRTRARSPACRGGSRDCPQSASAGVGHDGRARWNDCGELLLPDDAVLLLLRLRGARVGPADRLRPQASRVRSIPVLRPASAIVWITTGLFLLAAFFLAVMIPTHAQDALTFGEWSRLISQHWHLRYAA